MKLHRDIVELFVKGVVFTVAILILYFAVTGKSFANHSEIPILQGKVKLLDALCPIKNGKLDKESQVFVPCSMGMDLKDNTRFWIVIESEMGLALWVIEVSNETSKQKIVWKLGGQGV